MSTLTITPKHTSTPSCRTSNSGRLVQVLRQVKDKITERPAIALGSTFTFAGLSSAFIGTRTALKLLGPLQVLGFICFGLGMFSNTKREQEVSNNNLQTTIKPQNPTAVTTEKKNITVPKRSFCFMERKAACSKEHENLSGIQEYDGPRILSFPQPVGTPRSRA